MCFVNQAVVNGGMSMSWEAKWLSPRVVGRKGFLWTTYGGHTTCTQVSFGRHTLCAWCWKTRKCSTRLAAPRPPIHLWEKPCLLPKNFLPSLTPAFILQPHPHHQLPRDPHPLINIFIILVLSSMWSTPLNDRRRLAPRKWVASNAKSIHTPALSSCLKIHHHYLHWNHHNQHLLHWKRQIIVNNLRVLAQRWTLGESHLLKMDFGVFQPSAVLSIRITLRFHRWRNGQETNWQNALTWRNGLCDSSGNNQLTRSSKVLHDWKSDDTIVTQERAQIRIIEE